ncbi:hypothetical protein [Streptomyces sp. NPDC001816]
MLVESAIPEAGLSAIGDWVLAPAAGAVVAGIRSPSVPASAAAR